MGFKTKPDFGGYATRNDLVCSDGLTIKGGAFSHNSGKQIPLVWHHQGTESPENILGHAILEDRPDGVYAYAWFNESENGKTAKEAVRHGDITDLSILANGLRKAGVDRKDVVHGEIRELSLVMAGANPGAFIDNVSFSHSDGSKLEEDEGVIFTDDEDGIDLDPAENSSDDKNEASNKENLEHADSSTDNEGGPTVADKTVEEIYNTFTDEQKSAVDIIVGEAVSNAGGDGDNIEHGDNTEDSGTVQHAAYSGYQEGFTHAMNLFDQNKTNSAHNAGGGDTLSHDQLSKLMKDGKKLGSLRDSYLEHAEDFGINNIELLFPDAQLATDSPQLLSRRVEWVNTVLTGVKKLPFAKVKSLTFDITGPEARAKGYVKGTRKTEEVLDLLKRTTGPTTVYKKQKLDRDDILDITDFNIIVWLKWEIRFMLDEEIARAILVGDGRTNSDPDKIKDPAGAVDGIGIRSIMHENDLYAIKKVVAPNSSNADLVKEITRTQIDYRGSGTPTLFTSRALLIDILLEEDKFGRRKYDTKAALADALGVGEIVPVDIFNEYQSLLGIIVNLSDYSTGTNRGGEVTFFEDFDIDFNQEKYLMETRLSGALTKPFSAIVITRDAGTLAIATQPTFNPATNTITIPVNSEVNYTVDGEIVTGNVVITQDTEVNVEAASGHYLAPNSTRSWTFVYDEA
jgi:hypothetical protein